ncbi:MAG: DUF2442 domain-containing protein [Magnetococcales bacterium]|nr:DUF2442 domain-containing protein [Magnetococcales bacterium]
MTPAIINIVSVEQVSDFCLRLRFNDDTEQIVDFQPFLLQARHPSTRAWLDPARFATYRLKYGRLVWGDHDLCFPTIDLYRNQVSHHSASFSESVVVKVVKMSQKVSLGGGTPRDKTRPKKMRHGRSCNV